MALGSSVPPLDYTPSVSALLARREPNDLGPGTPNREAHGALVSLAKSAWFQNAADRDMASCCVSGLWLLHDFLDESHAISQDIDSTTGSYWHGIMHRREPDYGNSKYWFRRVGQHEIFSPLFQQVQKAGANRELTSPELSALLSNRHWDPFLFVDLCEQATRGGNFALVRDCRRIAQLEWQQLFDHSYRASTLNR